MLALLNATLVVATAAVAVVLFRAGHIHVGVVATALPMASQIANMAGWVAQNVTNIFENVGVVQDAMRSIDVARQMPDPPNAGRTVIAIAHRLSTIARMDRLVVLDRGRIREIGTHAQLLAAGGLYAQLWRRQSGGFLAESTRGRAATVPAAGAAVALRGSP